MQPNMQSVQEAERERDNIPKKTKQTRITDFFTNSDAYSNTDGKKE